MKIFFGAIILAVVAAVGWWLAAPLFIDEVVGEELSFDLEIPSDIDASNISEEGRQQLEERLIADAEKSGDVVMDEQNLVDVSEDRAVLLSKGEFSGTDSLHQGEGFVLNIQNGEEFIIRFEDFRVTNGPDLRVFLSKEANPISSGETGEYIEIGSLKGNVGNQNYVLPEGVDSSEYSSVIIYCKPFGVMFAAAQI